MNTHTTQQHYYTAWFPHRLQVKYQVLGYRTSLQYRKLCDCNLKFNRWEWKLLARRKQGWKVNTWISQSTLYNNKKVSHLISSVRFESTFRLILVFQLLTHTHTNKKYTKFVQFFFLRFVSTFTASCNHQAFIAHMRPRGSLILQKWSSRMKFAQSFWE